MLVGIDASRVTAEGRTGTETYSLYLIREILRQGSPHRFRLYFREPVPLDLFPSEGRWEPRCIPFPRLWTHVRLSWEMIAQPPEVLFVPAHVLPLVRPRWCLVTVHDMGYLYFPEAHPPLARAYLDWSTRFNCRVATRILALSETTRTDLARHYGVPKDKVEVVYPGVREGMRPDLAPAQVEAALHRHGVQQPYYLYVGTLQPRKNLIRLLGAFAEASRVWDGPARQEPRLVLAGKEGGERKALRREVRRLGLEGRVRFLGYVPDEDLPSLYRGALAFVFPSLYEGFGLPIVEAMACGTPVVCSATSACGEVAGDAGLLVDPLDVDAIAQALVRVGSDRTLRESLTLLGLERARAFSWERAARQVLAVLDALATEG
ncbi:MAG: glycosyltransferase family 4 protein [Anaerolineae bacterium]